MSLDSQKQAILFSHPGCPPFAQQAARAFYDAGLLSAYVTTFAYRPRTNFGRYLNGVYGLFSGSANQELSRRQITELPDEMVITHPSRELLRTFVSRSRLGPIAADYVWENAELWFDRRVSRHHLHNARAVYGYEHAVLETFSKQRARGALNIYDMPTAHHKLKSAMLDTEVSAVPEGQTTYVRHVQRNRSRRNERTDAELALADLIICPSQFVRNSLVQVGVNPEKILVVPFGSPTVATLHGKHSNKSMIFLSAGNQSISKGTHYLLEAWRKLKPPANCELWLVGKMALPERLLVNMPKNVVIKSNIPRADLFEIYNRASVLVLPTLYEGFALVITEAMAHGLSVITTPNSGAGGFITHGREGLIVPTQNVERLAEAIEYCIHNPAAVKEMNKQALARAASWQWTDYRRTLAEQITSFLNHKAA